MSEMVYPAPGSIYKLERRAGEMLLPAPGSIYKLEKRAGEMVLPAYRTPDFRKYHETNKYNLQKNTDKIRQMLRRIR